MCMSDWELQRRNFRSIAKSMQIPIMEIDVDHRVLYANEKAMEALMIDKEVIRQGVKLEAFIASEQTELVNRWLKKIEHDHPSVVSVRVIRGDKSEINVKATAEPILVNRTVVGYALYGVDASRCMIFDDMISNEKLAFDSIISNSVAGLIIISNDNKIEYVNERVCEIVGRTRRELLGHDFREFLHPESLETVMKHHSNKGAGSSAPVSYEVKILTAEDTVKQILIHVTEIVRLNGETKTIAQLLDVTSIREGRLALKESEERYRILVETMADGLAIDDDKGCFTYVNRSLCQMLGYDQDELIGLEITKVFERLSERALIEKLRMRKRGESENYETYLKHKNGRLIPVIVSASPLFNANGEYSGSFAIFTDISKQKQTERLLQVSSDRALLYLDVMTHDIGNQHQIISGYAELLATLIDDERTQEILGRILESIDKCNKIISTVKTSDKLITAELDERDLTEPLVECVRDFIKEHEDVIVSLSMTEIQALVLADELLEKLFKILLQNSYDHNDTGREKMIWVSLERNDNGYLVSISDNGPGIPNPEKEILFDPKRRYGGISLHFARHIIEKYGGYIYVEDRIVNDSTQGAMFKIWFPLARHDTTQ